MLDRNLLSNVLYGKGFNPKTINEILEAVIITEKLQEEQKVD